MEYADDQTTEPMVEEPGLLVQPGLWIPWRELDVRASRSSGPGGQHVNTSSTRVEIAWNARTSPVLNGAQRARLITTLASRISAEGLLRVVASDTRSQRQNRALAEERLAELVRRGIAVKKARKRTKPTRSSVEKRLTSKRKQSGKKRERRNNTED